MVGADLVVLVVLWTAIFDAVVGIDWIGWIVIDAINLIMIFGLEVVDFGACILLEVVVGVLFGARVVKVVNMLLVAVLVVDLYEFGGRCVLMLVGDDVGVKVEVVVFFVVVGFVTIDLGGLVAGGCL